MTTALPSTRPGALALGRVAAGLTGASAVVHVLQATTASLAALAMALMGLVCLPCAWHLWRFPTASVWGVTALLDGAMLVLHLQWPGATTTGHVHHAGSGGGLSWAGLALVVGSLSIAAVALAGRRAAGTSVS